MKTTLQCPKCREPLVLDELSCANCGQEFCPDCTSPIDFDADHCPACGATFEVFCPRCENEIDPAAVFCRHCGLIFEEVSPAVVPEYLKAPAADEAEETAEEEAYSGICPVCETPLYIEDGFCQECGTMLCTNCGQAVDGEEDEVCPSCGLHLYFDCPLCGFELTAGTEICPNCNALFPSHCSYCRAELKPGQEKCQECGRELSIRQRQSARVVQTLMVGERLVRIVACPECGKNFNAVGGQCPECGLNLCPECQLILDEGEAVCPRCGTEFELFCPQCENSISQTAEVCPSCGLVF